jgi:hypothetical protein
MSSPPSTNGYASLEQLRAAAPMAERDLEPVPGVRVRIRALSRHAMHTINREAAVNTPAQDLEKVEHLTWVHGLVAPAVATEEDAAALFAALDPAVAQVITDGIYALSGTSAEAQATSAAAFQPPDAGRGAGV